MRMQELLKLFLWTNCGVAFFVEQIMWIDKGSLQPLFVTSFRSFLEFSFFLLIVSLCVWRHRKRIYE